jgi:hypothetical protein
MIDQEPLKGSSTLSGQFLFFPANLTDSMHPLFILLQCAQPVITADPNTASLVF